MDYRTLQYIQELFLSEGGMGEGGSFDYSPYLQLQFN